MGSIVGENKWKNAISDDIAGVDGLISSKTAELNNASLMYNQALTSITLCKNSAYPNGVFKPSCVKISGRHIDTWREQRDTYAPLVALYKTDLIALQERRAALVASANESAVMAEKVAVSNVATAKADEAIAQAETVQATATASKLGIYAAIGGGVLVLIIGGIVAYKMIKKK